MFQPNPVGSGPEVTVALPDAVLLLAFPLYVAVTVTVAVPVTVRVAEAVAPDKATGVPVMLPLPPVTEKVTVPVGLQPPETVAVIVLVPAYVVDVGLALTLRVGAALVTVIAAVLETGPNHV